MAGTLGTITGQVRIDTTQAVAAYAALRAANIATLLALRSASATFIAAGAAIGGLGLAITAAFAVAIKSAADFERQLDFFGAVSASTTEQMEAVRAKALELGKDTIFSAGEIADSFVELGKAGVSAQQIIDGVGRAVASLGAAADIPLDTAANIITAAVQTFKLSAEDAVRVADLLAGSANASIVEVEDLGVSLKYVGGVAASISLPIEDVINALSLLGQAGIRGSTAGTSLRQILVSLTGTSKKASGVLKELGIITEDGTNKFFDAQGKAKPLADIFQILQDHTEGLTEAQRLSAFKIIFNNRALAAANILARAGAEGFATMNAEISKTTAAEVAAKRLDNLSGDVEILRGNIETLLIEAGTPFQNFLRGIVQGLTRLLQAFTSLPAGVQEAIFVTVAITGVLLLMIGAISTTIGLLFRFGANLLLLRGGITAVIKILSSLRIAMIATWLAALGPVGLIIAALVLLGIAFVILWKKSETFRNAMKATGEAIVTAFWAVVHFFQSLPGIFSALWGAVVGAFNTAKNAIVAGWNAVATFFIGLWNTIVNGVSTAIGAIVGFFQALPGRTVTFVQSMVSQIVAFIATLPERVAYWLGFMMGRSIAIFLQLNKALKDLSQAAINGIISFFSQLPGRLWSFFTSAYNRSLAVWNSFRDRLRQGALAALQDIVSFFTQLPGRLEAFFKSAYNRATAVWDSFKTSVTNTASSAVSGIGRFLEALPGAVGGYFEASGRAAIERMESMLSTVVGIAGRIPGAVGEALSGLGGLIRGAFQRAIDAVSGLGGAAYEKAKSIGSSLWNGFKKGLGISSPSFIERAMFAIHDTLVDEVDFLGRMVTKAQKIGSATPQIRETIAASQAATSGQASRTIELGAASTAALRAVSTPPSDSSGGGNQPKLRLVRGELSLDASGRAFIRGVAEEVYDENAEYDDSLGRMG